MVRREGPVRGGDHPARATPRSSPRWAPRSRGWRSPTAPEHERAAEAVGERFVSFDDLLVEDPEAWPGREIDPMLPSCIMFTSGTTLEAQGRRPHARQRHLGQPDRSSQHRSRSRRPLPRVHAVLPRERADVVAVARLRHRRHGRPRPEVVVEPFLGRRRPARITHFSLMPFCMSTLMAPDRPTSSLRVGVFGLIVPNARAVFGCEVYAAYGMTETVTHAITGKAERASCRSCPWAG